MENEFKTSNTNFWQRPTFGWALAVFVFVLVFASGLAITQTVFATHGPGPTPSDQSCTICPDNDKDGYRAYCDTSHVFDKSFSCGWPPPDCNDADPWSHSYGSKDIASVKVEYAPAYVTKTQTDKKFTPDSKKLNPTLGDLLVTVTFKAKKCGMTTGTPALVPMKIFYTTKDSSGNEVSFNLISATPDNRTLRNLAKVSDLVYKGLISTSQDARLLPGLEPYIASVAAGRSLQLKFLGSDVGPNKDSPFYYTFPPTQMTNCAQVYGGGIRRVVYMRTDNVGIGLNNFMALSSQAIYTGFNAIEPFKSYRSNFSHYVDLKSHILSTDALITASNGTVTVDGGSLVRTSSSCGRFSTLYFLFDDSEFGPFNAKFYNRVVYMDTDFLDEESEAIEVGPIAVHETAHAMAGLMDEYNRSGTVSKNLEDYLRKTANSGRNCSTKPSVHYSYFSKSYGRLDIQPCVLDALFRPSENSMMMGGYRGNEDRFNVISCGYLLKAIKKGGTAKSYWPECATMPGIVPVGQ